MKRESTATNEELEIVGYRIERAEKEPHIENGVPVLRAGTKATLRLFGTGFTNKTTIGLTSEKLDSGVSCNMMIPTGFFKIIKESSTNSHVEILLPKYSVELYICATNNDGEVSALKSYHNQHVDKIFYYLKGVCTSRKRILDEFDKQRAIATYLGASYYYNDMFMLFCTLLRPKSGFDVLGSN